ncbi:MAG: alpha/beta fold hydrolase [Sphingomonadaceae bacterium]
MVSARHRLAWLTAALLLAGSALTGCAERNTPSVNTAAAVATADQFVMIDGARIRVRVEGPATAETIILIHGFSFSLETWDGWARELAKNYRVIRYDLAGHGLSDPDPAARYGTQDRVRQLAMLMDELHIREAVLAGNSYGGLVAWNFAAKFPDRVDKLILVDSAAYTINGVTEKPAPVPPAMRAYLLEPRPAAVAYSASTIFAHPERLPPERLELMRAMIARPGNGAALLAHLEQFALPEPDTLLGRIRAPTLILWGRSDKVIPVDHAGLLAAAIPRSKVIIYDDVGHVPQEEATSRSLTDVSAFLEMKP